MKKVNLLFIAFLGFIVFSHPASAARFFLQGQEELVVGKEVRISLVVDTENQSLNAFEGTLIVPEELKIKSTDDGNSIISLWIEKPPVSKKEMFFSGGLPGGYTGKNGVLFSMTVAADQAQQYIFGQQNMMAMVADGLGTLANISPNQLMIELHPNSANQDAPRKQDDLYPPENFSVEISRHPDVYNNKYFLTFATTDKNSGVDHYEIKEGVGKFQKGSSPYLLKNQSPGGEIIVRVFDRAGNIRDVALKPSLETVKTGGLNFQLIITGLALILIAIMIYVYKKIRR